VGRWCNELIGHVWPINSFSTSPQYIFDINFVVPPVSDNLITIIAEEGVVSPTNLAIYDVTTGNNLYTTDYRASSRGPAISSNGENMFIFDGVLRLCRFIDNNLEVMWEGGVMDWYEFFDFDPIDQDRCYLWNNDKSFTIRTVTTFSYINSFTLDVDRIINVDYHNRKILGYGDYELHVYNLDTGFPEDRFGAVDDGMFLCGNTVYNQQGLRYEMRR